MCYPQLALKAVTRLTHDWERLITFYQFSPEHWRHLRTTNVVELPGAAVRLRTTPSTRFKKVDSDTALIWKVLQVTERTLGRLTAPECIVTEGAHHATDHMFAQACVQLDAPATADVSPSPSPGFLLVDRLPSI